jgi:hypothetical protein
LEIFLPAVGGSEEVEPHEIEDAPQFREASDDANAEDDVGYGEHGVEGRSPMGIPRFWWGVEYTPSVP